MGWKDAPEVQQAAWASAPEATPTVRDQIENDAISRGARDFAMNDMTWLDRLRAGIGKGMTSVGRAVGLGGVAGDYGLPTDAGQAEKQDAALMRTTAGKVGDVAGHIAGALPAVLIPGANTYAGAAAIGGLTGAVTSEGDIGDRMKGAALGAAGGAAGKALGDLVGAGAQKISQMAANRANAAQVANATRDAALNNSRAAGYVVTPSQAGAGGMLNSVLEGAGGKIKTAQSASLKNQEVSNTLVKQALGLPPNAPLTIDVLHGLRKQAGQAYDAVRGAGVVTTDPAYDAALSAIAQKYAGPAGAFPGLVKPEVQDLITSLRQPAFDAGHAVDAMKILRETADGAYRSGNTGLANAAKEASAALESQVERHVAASGQPDLLKQLRDARTLIAKTHAVEDALNQGNGNIVAGKLGAQLQRGKPLSGELKTVAEFSKAFPKSAQEGVAVPSFSPLDMFAGGAGIGSGNPALAALFAARPAARSIVLNPAYQRLMVNPSYGPGLLTRTAPAVLDTAAARALARAAGMGVGVEAAQ